MRISQLIVALIFGLACISLISQEQQSGETKVGSEAPPLNIYKVAGHVSAPQIIKAPGAEYPEEARQHKVEGKVVLWVVIGPDGLARNIRVQRSLGYGLDEEAIKTVKQWKFKPAKLRGQPVAVQINIEMNFRLR